MKEMKEIMEKIDDMYWACHRFVRGYMFEPVWYRFFGHKHHIVKTKLKPSPWYDADTRILYSVMEIVQWYVDNDMRVVTKEEYEEEIERINKEDEEEYREDNIQGWKEQYERDLEIIEISNWWKNHDKAGKEIHHAVSVWHDYVDTLVEKYKFSDFIEFLNNRDKLDKSESKRENRLLKFSHMKEEQLQDEEEKYLKRAIDLREHMWS